MIGVNILELTNKYIKIINRFTDESIFLVGGPIRDYFLKKETKDFDIVIDDDIFKIAKKFADENGGSLVTLSKENEVVRVVFKKDEEITIDFSSMRGSNIYDDLANRDFTINSIAAEIKEGKADTNNLIDPFNGLRDIENGIIRGVTEHIFEEDPIRMLRAVRLMAELNFDITDETKELINKNSEKIKDISGERINHEIFKILSCKRSHYYFNLMDKHLNILDKVFPEIEPMKEVGRCKYHVVDAWNHSLYTMRVIEDIIYADGYFEDHLRVAYEEHTNRIYSNGHTRIQLIKLGALFHDIGKPGARWEDKTGRVRFRGHEIVGEEIMDNIAQRLKMSNKEKKFLCKIVRQHMWPLTLYKTNDVSGRALYDLFMNFGENTLDIILIGLADIIATRQLLNPNEEMGMYKVHAEYLANNYLTRFKHLEDISEFINGNDILENFNIEDKRMIGEILDSIKKAIFFGEIPLDKKRIFKYIGEQLL